MWSYWPVCGVVLLQIGNGNNMKDKYGAKMAKEGL